MNSVNKNTLGILVVLIGRENSIDSLFDYFEQVQIPPYFKKVTLYFVKSFNEDFEPIFEAKIKQYNLKQKYHDIVIIKGIPKVRNKESWKQWEKLSRIEAPTEKHKSTAENLHRGINEATKSSEYVHIIDDDTIPPTFSLNKMITPLLDDKEVGMTSGLYFCKGWTPPSVIKGKQELKRKLVLSIDTNKWNSSTLEDLLSTSTTPDTVGFVGNGCILAPSKYLRNTLPLNILNEQHNDKGPDWFISYRIRKQKKQIKIVTSVLCKHLDEEGNEVGIPNSYFNKLINSNHRNDHYLISVFSPNINYLNLLSQFDYIKVIVFKETKELFYKKYSKQITPLLENSRIEILERSIKHHRELYKNPYNTTEAFKLHIIQECCLELMNLIYNYNISIQPTPERIVNHYANRSLNSKNLKLIITP